MQLHQYFFVQGVECVIIQFAWVEAEANDVQTDWGQQFHVWIVVNQFAKVVRLLNVAIYHASEPIQAVFFDGHPHFECAKIA